MTQIPILEGDDEKMRIKHSTITLILIQLFVISAIVGALSPTVSATQNDTNTITSSSEFLESPMTEDATFDWFDGVDDHEPEFVPGEILVKFKTDITMGLTKGIVTTGITSIDKLNKRFEANGMKKVFSNVYKLKLPKDADVLSIANGYEADPNVEYAEPNGIYYTSVVPNDANYTQQWAHQMIESEYAWNTTTGDPSVLVAVLDSGIDYNHPDLDDNYVSLGYDWVNNDNDTMDDWWHGTHCAGIIAAEINNNIGVAGLAQVQIMAEKVLNYQGDGEWEDIASGILHAADQGADIISMSLGGYEKSVTLQDAVKNVSDRGVLLVAAAGNDRMTYKFYPAAFDEVIAVTATDQNDNPASFTNKGNWVELAAPGVNILSTFPTDDYFYASGTSMACPHVAGVASLIWSQFPDMTRDIVRYQLKRTAVDKGGPGFDIYYGYGRINASGAVNQDRPDHDLIAWDWKLPFASEPSDTVMVNTTVLNFGKNTERNIYVKLLVNGTEEDSKKIKVLNSEESATVSCTWTSDPESEGKCNVTTYVVPVRNEEVIEDNVLSAYSWVRFGKTFKVRDEFPTIQEAIETTNRLIYYGDVTIWVESGTYNEYDLLIYNSLTSLALVGEDRNTTIISGSGAMGPFDVGVFVSSDNVTVTGFTIQNNFFEIFLTKDTENCIIKDNILVSNSAVGIYLEEADYNTVSDNTVSNTWIVLLGSDGSIVCDNTLSNGAGIHLHSCTNTTVCGNTVSNSSYGICLKHYGGNVIHHNNFIDNTVQASCDDSSNLWNSSNHVGNYWSDYEERYPNATEIDDSGIWDTPYVIDENNTDNYPLIHPWGSIRNVDTDKTYLTIQKAIDASQTSNGHTIEVKAGTYYENVVVNKSLTLVGQDPSTTIIDANETSNVITVQANNVNIEGFTIQNGEYGIYLDECSYGAVSGNWVLDNAYDIYLFKSSNNTVSDNTAPIIIVYNASNNNVISGNTVLWDRRYPAGIRLFLSNYNTVCDNTVSNFDGYIGIWLLKSIGNTITNNTISNSTWSISIGMESSNNTISDNIISNGYYGIYLNNASDNTIHHNNFINNIIHAANVVGSSNTWNSTNLVGNYWDDYSGQDLDGDGIGDTPYVIDANNQDDYPLMWKWFPGDLDGDGDVDDDDLDIFEDADGSQMGDPNYNPLADLDYDGDVDDDDYAIFQQNYGKTIPY